jgi:hypothetical protein
LRGVGDVDGLKAVGIRHEQIPELQRRGAAVMQRHDARHHRCERLIEIQNDEAGIGDHIDVVAADGEVAGAVQNAALIPGERAAQDIVARIPVGKGIDVGEDQSFAAIRDQRIVVEGMKRPLLIIAAHERTAIARRIDGLVGRQCDA